MKTICCSTVIGAFLVLPIAGTAATFAESPAVLTGIDVLQRDGFQPLQGKRVGLITNHTGVNREGVSTVKLLHEADNVELVALFSPEHGFAGKEDVARIADSRDRSTGLKIYSLYGATRTPTDKSLEGLDALVFDIQDIGTRFYTYISTMGNAMRAAAKQGIDFVVLDRPNPIGGVQVQGPVLDAGSESFVGFHSIAIRHGMTTGELAGMFRDELELDLNVVVIKVKGWQRKTLFDGTGLRWINPSPNMRNLTQAFIYPGLGILETTNLSVGRGTDTPFEIVGAPWIDCLEFAAELNAASLPGIRFVPVHFRPDASKYQGEVCEGVNLLIVNRAEFDPLATGFTIALTLRRLYPNGWQTQALNRLLADAATQEALLKLNPLAEIRAGYQDELEQFRQRRARYLLYP